MRKHTFHKYQIYVVGSDSSHRIELMLEKMLTPVVYLDPLT